MANDAGVGRGRGWEVTGRAERVAEGKAAWGLVQ